MIPLLLALTLALGSSPSLADTAALPAEPAAPVLMGEVLSPPEYAAWVVGYTDAMGLAWYRALARLDPDGGLDHVERVLAAADDELAYAREGLSRVPAYVGDTTLIQGADAYAAALGQTLHEGLPVLMQLLSAEVPDDAGLVRAEAVWSALVRQRVEHQAALDAAQATFAAAHDGEAAPSLVPWQALPGWDGPSELALPGPMTIVLAARRHNALVPHQRALVASWGRVAQLAEGADPGERAALRAEVRRQREALQRVGALAGRDGLRLAVLGYAEALEAGLDLDREERAQRLRAAHRAFDQAQADYQAWWRFEEYLAWAGSVRAGG